MNTRRSSSLASALQLSVLVILVCFSAILLASSFLGSSSLSVGDAPAPTLGDYPNTSVGLSGGTTVIPSAAPANTTSVNVSTNTNFKGIFVASPVTGVVSVTDAHPAGFYPVTVTAFGPGGTATKSFILTVISTSCAGNGFINAADVSVSPPPIAVAIGDFNGDGKQDLAVVINGAPGRVSIRLGDGMGGFSVAPDVSVGLNPIAVAIGDFNGDGKQDLAVANNNGNTVSIRLGDGMGGFGGSTNVAVDFSPVSVAIGDFNGDGKQDLAAGNSPSTVSIRLGDGMGGFTGSTNMTVGVFPNSIAIGDFNGDGKEDLAVANQGSNTVSIRLGDGMGGFSGSTNLSVGNGPQSVAIGDFNGDGKQDLAVANYGSNTVSIRLGDGTGGFSGSTNLSVENSPHSVAIGDFNGDGNQDLAAANFNANIVSIRLGDGLGSFSYSTDVHVGNGPQSVAIGDFDGDGKQDLAVLNTNSRTVSIRLGRCGLPSPTPTPTPTPTSTPTPTPTPTSTPCGSCTPTPLGCATFSNSAPISVPASGTSGMAGPYPSNIVVSGLAGTINNMRVGLSGITHAHSKDIDVMLVGPGGQNAIIMSDVGGYGSISGVSLILDDAAFANFAPRSLPNGAPVATGTYRPANYVDCDDAGDVFPAPAPTPSGGSALFVFRGKNPNGTWSLYVVDDTNGDTGSISGGWSMTIETTCRTPTPAPVASPSPGPFATSFVVVAPSVVTAGAPFNFTVQARDQHFDQTNYSGTMHFTSSDPSAVLPPNSGLPSGTPQGTFTATLNQSQTGQSITATDTNSIYLTGTSACITVQPSPTPVPVSISGTVSYCSNPTPVPIPNVILSLTGSASDSVLTNGSGNYIFLSLPSGGNYTVTPSKADLPSGAVGINTVDVIAIQRHYLGVAFLTGCPLTAADVNGDASVTTVDIIAVQRFFLGLSSGLASVGKYQFNPASRSYLNITGDQANQNFGTIVFGDVAAPFVTP